MTTVIGIANHHHPHLLHLLWTPLQRSVPGRWFR
jgi:hypothetical protein